MAAVPNHCCPLCNFSAPTWSLWLSHLRGVHSDDENFLVTCGINGCVACYTKCASFVSHLYRQHRGTVVSGHSSTVCVSGNPSMEEDESPDCNIVHEESTEIRTDIQHAVDQILETDYAEQMKKSALFILNLKEIRSLPESTVEHIVKETQKMFTHTVGRIRAGVNECISKSGANPTEIPNLAQFLADVQLPFQGLHSTFLREKYYKQQFGCLVSDTQRVHCSIYRFRVVDMTVCAPPPIPLC